MKRSFNNIYLDKLMLIAFLVLFFVCPIKDAAFAATGCAIGAFLGDGIVTAGMINNYESMISREIAAVTFFKDWTSGFPASECDTITNKGSIPIITWEPRNWSDPNDTAKVYELQDIINGNYDAYLTTYATAAKAWGKPVFIRFAHEMNGNWYPWSGASNGGNAAAATNYINAWRHVHDIFTTVGATNVIWSWCPTCFSVPGDTWNELVDYYPGDPYVDWIGFDGYSSPDTSWFAFYILFGADYNTFNSYGKPMMIGEMSCAESSEASVKAAWIPDTFTGADSIKNRYPNIKLYIWFNMNKEYDWRVNSSASSEAAFRTAMADTYYLSTLEAVPPKIISCSPARYRGDTATSVSVVGSGTNFQNGVTTAQISGTGVTIGSVSVTGTTAATVNITSISTSAATGVRDVRLITNTEVATGEGLFTINAPSLSNITPDTGIQGTMVNATVNGVGTHFNGASTLITFSGAGVTGEVTGGSATSATVKIYVSAGAAAGTRNVTMTTNLGTPGTETITGNNLFTVNTMAPPTAPTDFVGAALTSTSIRWTWTDVSDETNYVVCSGTTGNTAVSTVLGANTVLWNESTGLTANTQYTRHIDAINAGGTTEGNNDACYTLTNDPTGLATTGATASSISLSWTAPTGGAARYRIDRADDVSGVPGGWITIVDWAAGLTAATITNGGLLPNTTYWYRVYAYNGDGAESINPTNNVSGTTLAGGGPTGAGSYEGSGDVMVAFPNPFDPEDPLHPLKMQFHARAGDVYVYIFDETGRIVWKKEYQYPSEQDAQETWDGNIFYGDAVNNGYYMVRVVQDGRLLAKGKIIVTKR